MQSVGSFFLQLLIHPLLNLYFDLLQHIYSVSNGYLEQAVVGVFSEV
jgi:hypothetical protein